MKIIHSVMLVSLLVFMSLIVVGAFTTQSQQNFTLAFTFGTVIASLIALSIAAFSLITMAYFNFDRDPAESYSLWYFGYIALAFVYYIIFLKGRVSAEDIAHFQRIED